MQKSVYEFISKTNNDSIVERRTCTVSGKEFAIFQSDVDFLEKISPTINSKKYSIPLPKLCPEERQRRRLLRRNERKLYRRKCDATGKFIISIYSETHPYKVYDEKIRRGDAWDPMEYGFDYDFNKTFVEQFDILMKSVPQANWMNFNNENSDYVNYLNDSKNSYLSFGSGFLEDCYYCNRTYHGKNLLDCGYCFRGENSYMCVKCENFYHCMYCQESKDITDCTHCFDCQNCTFCTGCVGLRGQQYCILNKKYSKEEYQKKIEAGLGEDFFQAYQELRNSFPKNAMNITSSEKSCGNDIKNSKNAVVCYEVDDAQDCKYCTELLKEKDFMDVNNNGWSQLMYDSIGFGYDNRLVFTLYCGSCSDLSYCAYCQYSNNLFGCVGLKKKQYCIFNKQYTQEEYEKLVPQLIQKMKTEKEWRFFNPAFAAYPYNDSLAIEYSPIKSIKIGENGEEKIIDARGQGTVIVLHPEQNISDAILDLGGEYKMPIKRKNVAEEINIPAGITIVDAKNADMISDEEILKVAFRCEESGRPYKILKQELDFYKLMKLPIPTFHYDVRYKKRLQQKPTRDLHVRSCDKCGVETLSVYPQNADFKVYCESCYNKEIYG